MRPVLDTGPRRNGRECEPTRLGIASNRDSGTALSRSVEDLPPRPAATAALVVVIVIVVIAPRLVATALVIASARCVSRDQLFELAAVQPDPAAAVTTVDRDAIAIDLLQR